MQCRIYSVQCGIYSVQCRIYSVHYRVLSVQSRPHMQHVVGRAPQVDVLGEERQEGRLLLAPHRVGPVQLDLGGAGVPALLAWTGEGAAKGA